MAKHDRRREKVAQAMALRHMARGGPFGAGPMFGGPPFGGGRGRKRRGDVRAALLLALAEEPRNGYQLMQVIEERSGGRWRPSPGSVYPALAQLEDEGLIRSIVRDEAKMFEITDQGREHLDQRHAGAPPWELDDEPGSESFAELMSLSQQIHLAAVQVAQAGDDEQVARAAETLTEARRALYRILAEDSDRQAEDSAPEADV
jgi:DNA-binding PadR family transcriptional regulator